MDAQEASFLGQKYLAEIAAVQASILKTESVSITRAAAILADRIAGDRLIYIFGPGGHSNLAAQEIFYRAGSLAHVSAILDAGTFLSTGALKSTAMERLPGYGQTVIEGAGLVAGDALMLVNAFGINSAVIDAALAARRLGLTIIGLSGTSCSELIPPDHPARHPSAFNLQDIVDVHIDTKVPEGDAVVDIPGTTVRSGSVSTFTNAFSLQWLMLATIAELGARGIDPPVWTSSNSPRGDESNQLLVGRLRGRVSHL
ncbi:sugar isomerase domain-containing protein [Arthrobacter sp. 4R501]|uniref:sugar isomerase domain-containing protein n=1 Tax=Arthrobacter sp. 4R501 TaxID=2058886 RepID=UPI000CE3C8C1|nr:sugar isomerase domain-containing protein [Arthrobacter sp. 4R501]